MQKHKKILVVDDDTGILLAVQMLLEDEGYAVIVSDKGDMIEQVVQENHPDLLLLDMLLSGKDGREITRHLKSQTTTCSIPIILFSAHPSLYREASAAGADDYLAKPFKIEELLAKIEHFA